MAETDSEKILKDTLIALENRGAIKWFHRYKQQYSRAPLDFEVWLNNGEVHHVEAKETQGTTLPFGNFDAEQRDLLHHRENTWLLVRYYSGEYTRAHSHYYEQWFWLPGDMAPSDRDKGSSLRMNDLLEARPDCRIAYHEHGRVVGISEDAGCTTQGNPSKGLTCLPIGGASVPTQ